MRIKAQDPQLVSIIGDFMKTYLPGVRNRDEDTIASYRYSINLFIAYLEESKGLTFLTIRYTGLLQVPSEEKSHCPGRI